MEKVLFDGLTKALQVKTRPGPKNTKYEFIASRDVVNRMNEVFQGDWSVRVVEDRLFDTCVVVKAEVSIYDYEKKVWFSQQGYGGKTIYDSDKNDLGNAFKSALSKAIRDACKRWGVGSGEDDEMEGGDSNTSGVHNFTGPTSTPMMPPPTPQSTGGFFAPPIPDYNPVGIPATPPPVPPTINNKVEVPGNFPSMAPPNPVPASPPAPPVKTNSNGGGLNDIQIAAIEGLVGLKGISYDDLVKGAFKKKGIDIATAPELKNLTYQQAIDVISYGNSIERK